MRLVMVCAGALALAVVSSAWAASNGSQCGMASWYGPGFQGNPTASGEPFNQYALTAAHPTLPFGTIVIVERADGDGAVRVRINDRGPYVGGRIIDLSRAAADRIDMIDEGVAEVRLTVMGDVAQPGSRCA